VIRKVLPQHLEQHRVRTDEGVSTQKRVYYPMEKVVKRQPPPRQMMKLGDYEEQS
jgi:hypothetical protein